MSTPGPDDSQPQSPEELGGLNPKELFNAGLESAPPVTVPPQPVDPDVTARMSQPCTGFVIKTRPELPLPEELTTLLPKGAYQVEKFLGQGGMGAVYKGMQLRLKRPVAIKIMRRDFGQDHDFESRFEREAQAMAKLSHPNIVCVHDYGEAGPDYLYIVMELVDGADMMDVIRTRRITQEMALTLLPQICDALQFAHDHGIVHRDIKPSNIMLTRDGRIKMTDFGLAKRFDAESTLHTKTGTGMGSPDYAAPEQFDPNGNIDHRADIYALGVTIYHMITGSLPRGVWKPPSLRVELDPHWDDIVSRAMQSDPKDRYQQASEVKTDVSTIGITPSKAPDAFSPPTPVVRPRRGFDIQGRFHGCGIYLAVSLCALIFGGTYVVNHLEKKEPSMDMALATETREPTLPNLPTPKASDGPLVASAPSPPPPAPSASKPTAGTNPTVDGMKPATPDGVSVGAKAKEPTLPPMPVAKPSDGPLVARTPSPPPQATVASTTTAGTNPAVDGMK
ncbi:MAG: serine/threonine protein kinase, partial [Verrucomicrobiaceae bacterium]|nr:serine/threonine protein kinase [Verrucomicrobiaceae bacterium]